MPGSVFPVDITGQVADLLRDRRRRRVTTGQQTLTWTHDRFVAPATYQLTSIPYGINALADNGSVLSEGTDYTVDYTTGLITFGTGRTAGHVIFVSYVTTGDLVAASGPADFGFLVDTFNRADSSSTLGTTSDGKATWTAQTGTLGISSNQAYASAVGGTTGYAQATVPWSADGAVQATIAVAAGGAGVVFRFQDLSNFWFVVTETSAPSFAGLYKLVGGASTQVGGTLSGWANGDLMRVEFSGNNIVVKRNGTSIRTVTDTDLMAATNVGIRFSNITDRIDNFQAE